MALTRKALTAMGIEAEKIDQIIDMHTETTDSLKQKAAEAGETASRVPDLEKQIEDLKAAQPTEDWQARYEQEKADHDADNAKHAQERADAEKKSLYRALLTEAGIDAKRIDTVLRVTDLSDVAVKDGAIEGADELKDELAKEWADFIPHVGELGADPATPPDTNGSAEGADPRVVQRLQARHERLYGTTKEES